MDINTVGEVVARPTRDSQRAWRAGDAWLGGGTWLYSEPQTNLSRLFDLDGFGWTPIEQTAEGLTVAATCKIAEIKAWPWEKAFGGGPLIDKCCNALLGSFKIWNMATVGGNMCLALPAGPMTSLASALGATCTIWSPDGSERTIAAHDFVIGNRATVLEPGELLRAIHLPAAALSARHCFRQVSLTPRGRSGVLLIGLLFPDGTFTLTITASTKRPVRLVFSCIPRSDDLRAAIVGEVPDALYHDDIHGAPDWRKHLTYHLAEEIRGELAGEGRP